MLLIILFLVVAVLMVQSIMLQVRNFLQNAGRFMAVKQERQR